MRVRATDRSKVLHIPIIELRRIVEPGEEFELSEAAFQRLNGNGPSHIKFVEEVIVEKPVKKRKKKVNESKAS